MSRLGAVAGLLSVMSALAGVSCARTARDTDADRRYQITGRVERRDASTVTLAHDPIGDFMPAMTMDFRTDVQARIDAGDRIRATLVVTAESSRLTDIVVLSSGGAPVAHDAPPSAATALGGIVPDVTLRNQFDRPLRLHELRGEVVVVTFIYTRCPLPDFCPRLMRNFQELRRSLASRPALASKVRLLGVTIDPEFDTPAVLRAYGTSRFGAVGTFDRFDLATGDPTDVALMAGSIGLEYGPDSGQVFHTMMTAIIGTDGRLVRRYPEMTWDLTSALAILEREAARQGND